MRNEIFLKTTDEEIREIAKQLLGLTAKAHGKYGYSN